MLWTINYSGSSPKACTVPCWVFLSSHPKTLYRGPELLYHKTIIFMLQATVRVSLTHCSPDCFSPPSHSPRLVSKITAMLCPSVCLLVRCQTAAVWVWTAASSATTTSTVMPMTPYFMARVPISFENSFGLWSWLTLKLWELDDEQRRWIKRETLLFEYITFLDLF